MRTWFLSFVLCFVLMSVACANKNQASLEDAGGKADQGIQTVGNKNDQGS